MAQQNHIKKEKSRDMNKTYFSIMKTLGSIEQLVKSIEEKVDRLTEDTQNSKKVKNDERNTI